MEPTITVEELLHLGKDLAGPPDGDKGLIYQARDLLRVRGRAGLELPLAANKAQREFELARGQRNIVLKARQMGITTWVSGRFFLKTVTSPGVLTVQVAQTREAAEGIFRIVQRFWECLPAHYREGALKKSRSNVRQMIFPALDSEFRVLSAADGSAGRGLTIQNLHCSEVSRWPGDPRETLAGLRAALVPSGELVLESTPNGAYGCFYNEWARAGESGLAKHFLPWWLEEAYVSAPVTDFTEEEQDLVLRYNLRPEQIGFRRSLQADFGQLRSQEFAEDAERCFRATGDCCFEIEAIEKRMCELTGPPQKERRGALHLWAQPVPGKDYLIAVDTAGGGSEGDYSAVQVIDVATGMQCAELQERLKPSELAKVSAELATRYGGALIAVERNNHGTGVLAYLETAERYGNVLSTARRAGWMADDFSLKASHHRPAGHDASRRSPSLLQQTAAGGVPDLCDTAERQHWRGSGRARRLLDGHGDRSAGAGGTTATSHAPSLLKRLRIQGAVCFLMRGSVAWQCLRYRQSRRCVAARRAS